MYCYIICVTCLDFHYLRITITYFNNLRINKSTFVSNNNFHFICKLICYMSPGRG